jgi:hypothetical protein
MGGINDVDITIDATDLPAPAFDTVPLTHVPPEEPQGNALLGDAR